MEIRPRRRCTSPTARDAKLPRCRECARSAFPPFRFSRATRQASISRRKATMKPDEDTNVNNDYVGPNYFSTMGIPLIAGREFTEADGATSSKVCIINEKLAQRFFAGRNPI